MTRLDYADLLGESIQQLDESVRWLRRSYEICVAWPSPMPHTPEEFDAAEVLTSRFARVSDILLQKVFRSMDAAEMSNGGTLLDALNRAEKRGVIPSSDWFREIREIRNEIAHDYSIGDSKEIIKSVLEHIPSLLASAVSAADYGSKLCERLRGLPC